ncbi:circadian locomoter output cycles protein kaput-like isoform X1 [Osmia bicornis bicornis]|uniref:circadian locomoter output cycles protein kaput-like isoform X1 n=2 Tax=Osmia bicornis bicornis TaxID=1437191 RepID=UPI001EAEA105|nr:circadian locomoter output cycles protein kaput-like isoform X1 [Osmia bicornis bicornis]XP_029053405.2 circadian locomoter output cycles protein kaput-like isoform X1 [Osmia bicornis bicornis]XP_029053406.2 circadian locomoter output cycles protein kaput-like isoform X1 [Osmia bicornis bicornis]
MASYSRGRSSRQSDDTMDDDVDDKDDTKRKSRNLSEKKRRDQFNMLVNELGSMVNPNTRKMDKSTVLKSTISFLKNHNAIAVRSRVHEIQEDWKPSFLSNEEFTHLILEALDGFIMVFSSSGRIYYVSESVTSLLGYLPNELENTTIYDITYQEDQSSLYNVLLNPANTRDRRNIKKEDQIFFSCHIKRGGLNVQENPVYELVQFVGYFRSDVDTEVDNLLPNTKFGSTTGIDTKLVFVGTGRLQTPQLIRELSVMDNTKSEFTSRHSLEWKFLFLDHRAPPIIGYLPFEVLGTSGYDYYHVDDLDKVVMCHESLMQKGEGTSCYYRFLTKGQQWIWLQTRFYITYNQWNSKPEFIVCTHYVVSYIDVIKELRKETENFNKEQNQDVLIPVKQQVTTSCPVSPTQWPKSSRTSKSVASNTRSRHVESSDSSSVSASLRSSPHSQITHISRSKGTSANSSITSKTHPIPPMDNRPQQQQQQPQHQQQPLIDVDQSCINFIEQTPYATVNLQPVVSTAFAAPATPIVSTLSTPEMLHQQGIVMTPAQNQIQDELQRKHEELQQLIVHQQEELRRVSEQLFIARYGILSPLLNASMPYNATNACQQMNRCNTNNSNVQLPTSSSVQGVNVLPLPITVPVPIVPTELFSHPLTVSPVPTVPAAVQGNVAAMIQPLQPQAQQQPQQQASTQPNNNPPDLVPFQICPHQGDILYNDMETPANQQQRSSQN